MVTAGQPDAVTAPPELRTARLVLRNWRTTDRAPFAALNADPEVMRHFPSTLTAEQSDQMVDAIVARWAVLRFGLWAVERVDTGEFIGFVGLSSPTWSSEPLVEVGWRLARGHWGNGFATEAGRAVLAFGFAEVQLPQDEIVSFTTVENVRSRRVMERLGMRHDVRRDFDHPLLPDWSERRHVLYVLRRDEFAARSVAR